VFLSLLVIEAIFNEQELFYTRKFVRNVVCYYTDTQGISLVSLHPTRRIYGTESLHTLEHPVTAALFRTTITGTYPVLDVSYCLFALRKPKLFAASEVLTLLCRAH